MIQDTLAKIQERLAQGNNLDEHTRTELRQLLQTLQEEISQLSKTHAEQAQNIAGFAGASTQEAIREQKNPELLNTSLEGLAASVEGFETTHPQLVQVVNRICTTLANLGI